MTDLIASPAALAPDPRRAPFSAQRIAGMVLRYLCLYRRSWTRMLEVVYWPVMEMVLWGLITRYMLTAASVLAQAAGLFLGAVILWNVLFRSQLGVHVMFQEEMYARNLANLFISPLRPYELGASLLIVALLRTLVSAGSAALLAIPLYSYSIFGLGLPLVGFFVNLLIFGWAVGLMLCALLLRFGFGAEGLAWAAIFVLSPVSGVYYPVSILPAWIQPVAWGLPSSYVFEGMRAIMLREEYRPDLLLSALGLNLIYLVVAFAIFLFTFRVARRRGLLLNVGE